MQKGLRLFRGVQCPVVHAAHCITSLFCFAHLSGTKGHTPLQVYVRSESSEQHQQAAQQALHDQCQPLLASPAPPSSPLLPPGAPAPQLSLAKPCAWPFPVTASHFAETAAMTVLARDSALWEGYCAGLATGCSNDKQHVLQLVWKAAACFAERASSGNRTQRQLWSASTAAGMQVSRIMSNTTSAYFLKQFLHLNEAPCCLCAVALHDIHVCFPM